MMSSSGAPKRKVVCRSAMWLRRQRAKTDYHGSRLSLATTNGPPCQEGDNSEVAKDTIQGIELDKFPEDILHHIHSLVPLRDAARAACVSRRFLCSWRCFPNLTFNWKTLGLKMYEGTSYERGKKIVDRIYHILKNHSGFGVKTLKLQIRPCRDVITANHLDIWLQTAVKSGIVELAVDFPEAHSSKYNFPCLLLSCAATSIQSLSLYSCDFRPTLAIGCLRNLKSLCLVLVHITEDELGCFFSCTISLEKLEVSQCNEITFLKIPSHLQRLSILQVYRCQRLEAIEINAPKVTKFVFCGPPMKISITDSSQLEIMAMDGSCYSGMFHYALTKLYSIALNLHTLVLSSSKEAFNIPASPDKFLQLRHLKIYCCSRLFDSFDFLSLVSFLEACPVLETFFLSLNQHYARSPDSTFQKSDVDSWHIKKIPGFRHDNLKKATITGIWSSKSLIELTCQILENSSSLEYLTLPVAVVIQAYVDIWIGLLSWKPSKVSRLSKDMSRGKFPRVLISRFGSPATGAIFPNSNVSMLCYAPILRGVWSNFLTLE